MAVVLCPASNSVACATAAETTPQRLGNALLSASSTVLLRGLNTSKSESVGCERLVVSAESASVESPVAISDVASALCSRFISLPEAFAGGVGLRASSAACSPPLCLAAPLLLLAAPASAQARDSETSKRQRAGDASEFLSVNRLRCCARDSESSLNDALSAARRRGLLSLLRKCITGVFSSSKSWRSGSEFIPSLLSIEASCFTVGSDPAGFRRIGCPLVIASATKSKGTLFTLLQSVGEAAPSPSLRSLSTDNAASAILHAPAPTTSAASTEVFSASGATAK
mmetsp:Transcript_92876/g.170381  ORF Transcript_92876/g.170381 Transcript_92876/m.170381 type:complete len:284 (-) Transcript_92876:135-986(-)